MASQGLQPVYYINKNKTQIDSELCRALQIFDKYLIYASSANQPLDSKLASHI